MRLLTIAPVTAPEITTASATLPVMGMAADTVIAIAEAKVMAAVVDMG
jgi:hypothetical protein